MEAEFLFSGLIAAIVSTFISYFLHTVYNNKIKQKELTLTLFRQWNSYEMTELRGYADTILKERKLNTLFELSLLRNELKKDYDKIGNVLLFMSTYALYYNENLLDKKLDKRTMRPFFLRWKDIRLTNLLADDTSQNSEWNDWRIEINKYLEK